MNLIKDFRDLKAHKFVQQGFLFFHNFLATSMTNWAKTFTDVLLFRICWTTQSRNCFWQLPKVFSAFKIHCEIARTYNSVILISLQVACTVSPIWTEWEEWTNCSRKCDWGVTLQKRRCLQGNCQGPEKRYRTCKITVWDSNLRFKTLLLCWLLCSLFSNLGRQKSEQLLSYRVIICCEKIDTKNNSWI